MRRRAALTAGRNAISCMLRAVSLIPSFGAWIRSCLVPRYRSVVWTDAWPSSNWICSRSAPAARQNFAQERRASWGAMPGTPAAVAYGRSICQTTFSDSTSPYLVASVDGPEHVAVYHAGWSGPGIDGHLDPNRHRHRADAPVLPVQIHDAPAAIPLLHMRHRERRHFRPAQGAAQEHGDDGPVA